MAKQGKKHSIKPRHAPYPSKTGKPRVEVTYEGAAPARTNIKSQAANRSAHSPSPAPAPAPISDKAKGKARALEQETSGSFIVIAGSYEKLLYGVEGVYGADSDTDTDSTHPTISPIFIFPAHLACVKAIAASPGGKWLATGSEDEFIKVWDLRRRKEVGSLSQHTGSITSLHFPSSTHLVSTSVDGTIALFRTSDWALLKSLKGHSGRVNHVDVHPTGRVALSVGKDQTLKMWDLMRGRGAASLPLSTEAELVKFSPLGTHFAVLYQKKIEIYSLTLKLLQTLETNSRFNYLEFALLPGGDDQEVLAVGTEKGLVEVYDVVIGAAPEPAEEDDEADKEDSDDDEGKAGSEQKGTADVTLIGTLIGHTNRIKALSTLPFDSPSGPTVLLSTVSTDGYINVYDLPALVAATGDSTKTQKPLASYNTKGSRLTCVFLADGKKAGTVSKAAVIGKDDSGSGKGGVTFADANDDEDGDDDDEEEEEEDEDMYEQEEDDEDEDEEDDGVEVEFEDEEEEEDEEEME